MEVDIRTLILILGLTHFMQVLVFFHQYKINITYNGVKWWLMWSIAEVVGFSAILCRTIPSLLPAAIIVQNSMIVAGTVFLYIGVNRFLDNKVNYKILIFSYTLFIAGLLYFLFIQDHYQIRSVIIKITLAIVSLFTARVLFVNKIKSVKASATFVAVIFLVHGGLFIYQTVKISINAPETNFFAPTTTNLLPLFDALIVSLLWTFGLIMMLNQRLNAEVSEAKEKFKLIFDTSPDAALITRLEDGSIIEFNEGFTTISGYSREDMNGKSNTGINIWKNYTDRQNVIDLLKQQGYCNNYEALFVRKDGEVITGLLSAKTINLQGVANIISITRDITERKRKEEELAESELRFRSLFENMSEGVALHEMIYDDMGIPVDYRIVDVNSSYEKLTNISANKACGILASVLYQMGKAPYLKEYAEVTQSRKPLSFEVHFGEMKKDFSISVFSPKPGLFATIFLDITERKKIATEGDELLKKAERSRDDLLSILEDQLRSQEELRESEEKFAVAFRSSPYAITITRIMDGQFIEINDAFTSITGYTREETIQNASVGMGLWLNIEDRNQVLNDLREFGKVERQEFKFKRKSGEIMIGLMSSHYIHIKNDTCILSSINDISELKARESDINRLNLDLEKRVIERTLQLEESNKELESFSYSVSHDLRAPLRHISGYVDLLTKHMNHSLSGQGKHFLDTIADSAHQMGVLIDDLLQFSRTGRKEMHQQNIDMDLIFQEALRPLEHDLSGRNIEWVNVSLPQVFGDQALLRLVWTNLLSNAIKFTRLKKKARIETGFRAEGDEYLFFVRDNGTGFDMRYAQKLFGVFQRLHSAEDFEGTGIGLANVRRIILKHGGRIWAEAEVDKGATFYFTLPIAYCLMPNA